MNAERIIDRIKKMLALANDLAATEGERDNALRMAFSTMAKYNIDMAAVDAQGKQEDRINFENQSFSWQWAQQINKIIGELFFCKCYMREKVNGTQIKYHFIGKESNAMTAAVMADWIVKSILKEGRKLYKQNTSPQTRAFATGAMMALHHRVKEIIAAQKAASETAAPGTALVLASLYDTEQKANELLMPKNLRVKKARNSKVDGDAYRNGKAFGNNINLNNQIGASAPKAQLK
jgi:hypothetical protein